LRSKAELIDARIDYGIEKQENAFGMAFIVAAIYGYISIARQLLEKDSELLSTELKDGTALHYAVKYGRLRFVQWLLDQGSVEQLTLRNDDDETPLNIAKKRNDKEMIELLSFYSAKLIKPTMLFNLFKSAPAPKQETMKDGPENSKQTNSVIEFMRTCCR